MCLFPPAESGPTEPGPAAKQALFQNDIRLKSIF